MSKVPFINESQLLDAVSPLELDGLLASGWRHFGTFFFRHSVALQAGSPCRVLPLRVRVTDFVATKSQRRNLRRNHDLEVRIQPTRLDRAKQVLFDAHKQRFRENVPTSLLDFLSPQPDQVPCLNLEICVYRHDRLLAVSFLDVGDAAVSSVYAMFDPLEEERGLGIFTALLELEYAARTSRPHFYLGYAYDVPSHYDYKKRFHALESFDWIHNWVPFERLTQPSRSHSASGADANNQ
jgi:arginine-tRNA-protein transferase